MESESSQIVSDSSLSAKTSDLNANVAPESENHSKSDSIDKQSQETPSDASKSSNSDENEPNTDPAKKNTDGNETVKKERKIVSFTSEPEEIPAEDPQPSESLGAHSEGNIFGKIPRELQYLEKRNDAPKPLPQAVQPATVPKRGKKAVTLDDLPDLPSRAVKEISAVNKNTILNFNYHEVVLPLRPDRLLVDVKYSTLFSPDIAKLKKYAYNISVERIGIGYDFVGEIVEVGKKYADGTEFKKGDLVFGVTNPLDKKGALQTCVIVNSGDVVLKITDEDLKEMEQLDLAPPASTTSDFQIDDSDSESTGELPIQSKSENSKLAIPSLAKFCTFGSLYCRAKQATALMNRVFEKQTTANVLINGADTLLGRTIAQIFSSSVYHQTLSAYNITLVVSEKNVQQTQHFIASLNSGGLRKFNVVAYDMMNDDLVLPGETAPTSFKKVPFFASEIIESVLQIVPESEKVSKRNIQNSKLDLFIDIVGSKKMFQKSVDMLKLDQVNFPFKSRLEDGVKPSSLFGKTKGPLYLKLMKPKAAGASYVSFCDFDLSEPSYSIEKSISHKNQALDPWASSWTRGLANRLMSSYNYYEASELQIKKAWLEEGLKLVKGGELHVQIDEFVDWRDDFRKHIEQLKKHDGSVLFKIESF
ncbi:hypothetical protein OXX59_005578 [Metschnikowia pulcherrima]